jgi:SAM-dependent methyltransferase
MDEHDPAFFGQKHYTTRFLRIYDPLVLGFFASAVWRCPTRRLVDLYSNHLRARHLDVGPGTGYFLEKAVAPAGMTLTLIDPNPDVLAYAAARLSRLRPMTISADVLKQLPTKDEFDSIALNYLLHCLPGPQPMKAVAVSNVAERLARDGVLFGAQVLGNREMHTLLSWQALRVNNKRRIFDNLSDTEDGLREILGMSFEEVQIEIVGSVAVFIATAPKLRNRRPS